MARVKVLQRRVVAHKWREVGEEINVREDVARALTEQDPVGFAWLDRPVRQFVDVVEPAPVAETAQVGESAPAVEVEPERKGRKRKAEADATVESAE